MSLIEDRQNSVTGGQTAKSGSLPGLVSELSPVEQLSFPETTPQPFGSSLSSEYQLLSSPNVMRQLAVADPATPPTVTRNLTAVQTGALPSMRITTTSLREPVVIRSTGKKSRGTMRPPKGRRWVIHLTASVLLILIALITLVTVLPAGTTAEGGFNPFRPILDWGFGGNSNPNLLAQQAATVTAVTRDGYQPTSGQNYSGLPTPPPGSGTYDGFTYGQCTFYADFRYHQLTGFWAPWGGDAWAWAAGAQASGWIVSSSPHVPSIIVLQPYVQGASAFGHVAVVEGINSDGSVYTTNWNWYANGGGWATWSSWNFRPGPGVTFVWK
jgi:surface antigen